MSDTQAKLPTDDELARRARRSLAAIALGSVALVAALLVVVVRSRPPELLAFDGSYPRTVAASGVVREVELVAAPTELPLLPSQTHGKPLAVWAYNGQVPGPTLRVRVGDTLRATLVNRLPQATTIHWHGMRLPNAMDGVPGLTQPAVEPGERFVYEFTPRDPGTFWFHPHLSSSEQVERGLFGVLIVDERDPPPYSRDVVWVLDDWRLDGSGQIDGAFNTRHDLMHDGRWGQTVTVNGRTDERLAVKAGERVRLRLLNVANGRIFRPDFSLFPAGSVKVIAVDGMYAARPLDPDAGGGFELPPGARLDLDITVAASQHGQRLPVRDRFLGAPQPLAELDVGEEVVPTPDFPSPAHAHVPTWTAATGAHIAEPRATFRLDARAGGPFGIEWTINGQAFTHAQHAAHAHDAPDAHAQPHLPSDGQRLPEGAFSVLRFINDSFRLHPMHLHGSFFKVLRRNGVAVDEPHWRDTTLLHAKETVDVGLVPLERGRWMLHCHILEHAESGMMTTIEVR